jgi:uncharacterized protein (TIGR00645 family)
MITRLLERILFASRWLLAPLYLALIIGLVGVVIKAAQQAWAIDSRLLAATASETILGLLDLIDLTLISSLVVLVIFSGYENFVSRIEVGTGSNWPEWMTKIDFSGLKLKLLSSIVAISTIELLRLFMDVREVPDRDLRWYVILQFAFVVSGLLMALTDRFATGQPPSEDNEA